MSEYEELMEHPGLRTDPLPDGPAGDVVWILEQAIHSDERDVRPHRAEWDADGCFWVDVSGDADGWEAGDAAGAIGGSRLVGWFPFDPRWSTDPLPEVEEGAEIEIEWEDGSRPTYRPSAGRWRADGVLVWRPGTPCCIYMLRWRWIKRPSAEPEAQTPVAASVEGPVIQDGQIDGEQLRIFGGPVIDDGSLEPMSIADTPPLGWVSMPDYSVTIPASPDECPTLTYGDREFVCVDPDEWAKVRGAARSWSRLVQCISAGVAAGDDDAPLVRALASDVESRGGRESYSEDDYLDWCAIVDAAEDEEREAAE